MPTLYRYNWQVFNPAAFDITRIYPNYTFIEDPALIVQASYRREQLNIGLDNAPFVASLRVEKHPKITKQSPKGIKLKLGGFVIRNEVGSIKTNRLQANVSGMFALNSSNYVSLGMGLGFMQRFVATNELRFREQPLAMTPAAQSTAPSLGIGLFYTIINSQLKYKAYLPKVYLTSTHFGISIPQAFELPPFNLESNTPAVLSKRYYCFTAGTKVVMRPSRNYKKQSFSLAPSIWLKFYDGSRFISQEVFPNAYSLDVNLTASYNDSIWLGAGFSTSQVLFFEFGLSFVKLLNNRNPYQSLGVLDHISFAYSYPIATQSVWRNSIEFSTSFSF